LRALDAQPGTPGLRDFAPLLVTYPDVLRLAGPHWPRVLALFASRGRQVLVEAT
jgi:hypothetical protein